MGKKVVFKDLGIISYKDCWAFQAELLNEVIERKINNRKNEKEKVDQFHYFLLCEHPHVYTLGRNGKEENLLLNNKQLENVNATFHKINRGGDITYHGYGQLVVYPILDLDEFFTDIGKYIRFLEELIIRVLSEHGIIGDRIKGLSGVWIDPEGLKARKICAIGVHLSRWVTMHGFALNINTNLEYFKNIIPCGINDKAVTSMAQELGKEIDIQLIKKQVINSFLELFDAEPIEKNI